jgi:hypothetical protein
MDRFVDQITANAVATSATTAPSRGIRAGSALER